MLMGTSLLGRTRRAPRAGRYPRQDYMSTSIHVQTERLSTQVLGPAQCRIPKNQRVPPIGPLGSHGCIIGTSTEGT